MTPEDALAAQAAEAETLKEAAKPAPAETPDSSALSDIAGISDVIDGVGTVVSAVCDVPSLFE